MASDTLVEQQFGALKKAYLHVVEEYCDLVLKSNAQTDRVEALEAALRECQLNKHEPFTVEMIVEQALEGKAHD